MHSSNVMDVYIYIYTHTYIYTHFLFIFCLIKSGDLFFFLIKNRRPMILYLTILDSMPFFFLTRQAQYITARSLDMVPYKFTGENRNSKAKVTVVLLYQCIVIYIIMEKFTTCLFHGRLSIIDLKILEIKIWFFSSSLI